VSAVLRALILALALALPATAMAGGKDKGEMKVPPPPKGSFYTKLPTIQAEMYDSEGVFHAFVIDLLLVFPEEAKTLSKTVGDRIRKQLVVIPYEEYNQGNPVPLIKAIAQDTVRKDPGGDKLQEVLVLRLLMR
jgi:hypothetical protein